MQERLATEYFNYNKVIYQTAAKELLSPNNYPVVHTSETLRAFKLCWCHLGSLSPIFSFFLRLLLSRFCMVEVKKKIILIINVFTFELSFKPQISKSSYLF